MKNVECDFELAATKGEENGCLLVIARGLIGAAFTNVGLFAYAAYVLVRVSHGTEYQKPCCDSTCENGKRQCLCCRP